MATRKGLTVTRSEEDHGRAAGVAAVETLVHHARIGRNASVANLLKAIADVEFNRTNHFWQQQRPDGRPLARVGVAEFKGNVAGLILALSVVLGTASAAYEGADPKARQLRRLAEKMAHRLGIKWTSKTARSLYDRIVSRWQGGAGKPSSKWEALVSQKSKMTEHSAERRQVLKIVLAGKLATARGGGSLRMVFAARQGRIRT